MRLAGYGVRGTGHGMQDALSLSQCSQGRGKAAHSKMHFPLRQLCGQPQQEAWRQPSLSVLILALALQNRLAKNMWGLRAFCMTPARRCRFALPSLHRHPQIHMAPLLSDGAAEMPREPCQVRGIGISFLYSSSSSTLSKGKDRLCHPSTAQRELDAARYVLGVACSHSTCTPGNGKSQLLLHCCAWESKASWQAHRKIHCSCHCAGIKPLGASGCLQPQREEVGVVTVVALRVPQQVPRGPSVCSQVNMYPHALSILLPLHTLITAHAGRSVCDKPQRCILNHLFMPSRHSHLHFCPLSYPSAGFALLIPKHKTAKTSSRLFIFVFNSNI